MADINRNKEIGSINILGENFGYSATMRAYGVSWVILSSNSINRLKRLKTHPYFANINKGSSYSKLEKDRLNKGLSGCDGNGPKEAINAFDSLKNAAKSELGISKIGGNCACWSASFIFNRANPGSKSLEQCNGPGKIANKSCQSIHGVGRGQDIINTVIGGITVMYAYFDNRDQVTRNSNGYRLWLYFANNAHKYQISGISNEWWHWQYYGNVSTTSNGTGTGTGNNDTTSNDSNTDTSNNNNETSNTEQSKPIEVSSYSKLMAMLDENVSNKDFEQSSSKSISKKTEDNPEILTVSSSKLKQDELILEKAKE